MNFKLTLGKASSSEASDITAALVGKTGAEIENVYRVRPSGYESAVTETTNTIGFEYVLKFDSKSDLEDFLVDL